MKIPFIVLFIHLLIIGSAVYLQSSSPKIHTREHVAVRTFVQKYEPPAPKHLILDQPISLLMQPPEMQESEIIEEPIPELETPEPASEPVSEPLAKPVSPPPKPAPAKTAPASKPTTPKPAAKPTSKSPTKPTPKPAAKPTAKKQSTTNPNQQKLISMMQQSLSTLNSTGKTTGSTQGSDGSGKTTGKTIGKLGSETLSFEAKYEEELVMYLESLLSLPVKGEVKLKLTLKREGNVQKIDIINATSERNRTYIESTLTACSFPSFGSHFKGETTHSFTITLTSSQ